MTALLGTNISAAVVPFDDADAYSTHVDVYGQGGYRSVNTIAARDAIPTARRSAGMMVRVLESDGDGVTGRVWRLDADLTTWAALPDDAAVTQILSQFPDGYEGRGPVVVTDEEGGLIPWVEVIPELTEIAADLVVVESGIAGVTATVAEVETLAQTTADTFGVDDGYERSTPTLFLDAEGGRVGEINKDGVLNIPLQIIAEFEREGLPGLLLLDDEGGIIQDFSSDTSVDAVEARLDVTTDTAGYPTIVPGWGFERLRRTSLALEQLALGEDAHINIAFVGDSFTQNRNRYTGKVASGLIAQFGDGGGGWTGYSYFGSYLGPYSSPGTQPTGQNGNVRGLYSVTYIGAWDRAHNASVSPDLGHVFSATVGDTITRALPATPTHTAIDIFYLVTAGASFRWRLNGGAWTTVDASIGTIDDIAIETVAVSAGAQTLNIEVVSGTVRLCGDNAKTDPAVSPGVRIHKIAGSGSRVEQWLAQNAARQQFGWNELEVDCFVLMEGTNSQGNGVAPATWAAQITSFVGRFRAARSLPDVAIVMPPENLRTDNAYQMTEYAAQARVLSQSLGTAYLDLQSYFGEPSEYAAAGLFPLFSEDLVHPDPETGGYIMARAMRDLFKLR